MSRCFILPAMASRPTASIIWSRSTLTRRMRGDVFMQTVGMAGILDQMEKSGTKINLLVLDACRDNPFRDPA